VTPGSTSSVTSGGMTNGPLRNAVCPSRPSMESSTACPGESAEQLSRAACRLGERPAQSRCGCHLWRRIADKRRPPKADWRQPRSGGESYGGYASKPSFGRSLDWAERKTTPLSLLEVVRPCTQRRPNDPAFWANLSNVVCVLFLR
jgi:hypothetical protein